MTARAIRFCTGCGAAWQPEWSTCPACSRPAIQRATDEYTKQRTSLRSALLLYFSLLATCLLLLIIGLVRDGDVPLAVELTFDVILAAVVIAWAFPWFNRLRPTIFSTGGAKWVSLAVPFGIATYTLAHFAVLGISLVFNVPMIDYLDSYEDAQFGFALAIGSICVMPALFEELAFRGVILSALQDLLQPGEALLVSAMMFAILHLSVPSVPHLFAMGAVAAWMRQRSGSLLPGMILHFTHNFLVLLSERSGGFLPW